MRGRKITTYHKPRVNEVVTFNTRAYFAFPDGRIWNNDRKMVMKQSLNRFGYLRVILVDDEGKKQTLMAHRVIQETFVPYDKDKPEVNHKNEDKKDNRIENLEWCTTEYNNNYGTKIERTVATKTDNGAYARHSETMHKHWPEGVYTDSIKKLKENGHYAKLAIQTKKRWETDNMDETRAKLSAASKQKWASGQMDWSREKALNTMRENGTFETIGKKLKASGHYERLAEEHKASGYYKRHAEQMKAKLSKPCVQIKPDGSIVHWPSLMEAGRNGICVSAISRCCLGKGCGADKHTHKGSRWYWLADYEAHKKEWYEKQLEFEFSE